MEAVWVIIVIVAIVFRVLNKAGEITGEMKERIPEVLGEKNLPTVFKDWGFSWDEENDWDGVKPKPVNGFPQAGHVESPDRESKLPENITAEVPVVFQDEKRDTGIDRHPLLESSNLINGLILSELLQPPKSRRNGWRL